MSHGYGHVERNIFAALKRLKADFTTVTSLSRAMTKAEPTRSDRSSINRALRRLEAKGLVRTIEGPWKALREC